MGIAEDGSGVGSAVGAVTGGEVGLLEGQTEGMTVGHEQNVGFVLGLKDNETVGEVVGGRADKVTSRVGLIVDAEAGRKIGFAVGLL